MRVDVYTSPTCGYCHQAKKFLLERGVRFFEYDVSRDRDAAERMVNLTGQMGVPVIVIDGNVVVGFDKTRIISLIDNSGNGHRPGVGLKVGDATKFGEKEGVYIGSVSPESPGARAGLRKGDIILRVNSRPISGVADLEHLLADTGSDVKLDIVFIRDGQTRQTQVIR